MPGLDRRDKSEVRGGRTIGMGVVMVEVSSLSSFYSVFGKRKDNNDDSHAHTYSAQVHSDLCSCRFSRRKERCPLQLPPCRRLAPFVTPLPRALLDIVIDSLRQAEQG